MPISPVPPLPGLMLEPLVRAALLEDLGRAGDITSNAVVPAEARSRLTLVARQPGVLAGLELARLAFRLCDPALSWQPLLASVLPTNFGPISIPPSFTIRGC